MNTSTKASMQKPRPMCLKLSEVRLDPRLQSRAEINRAVVAEYRDAILAGEKLPPVKVVFDKLYYYLVDGYHRYEATKEAQRCEIYAYVTEGTFRDALLESVGVNAKHGLRRSNEDKRRAVRTLLDDPEWATWSARDIAKACGVSHDFVSRVRASLSSDDSEGAVMYTTKHGTQAVMNTANIGRPTSQSDDDIMNIYSVARSGSSSSLSSDDSEKVASGKPASLSSDDSEKVASGRPASLSSDDSEKDTGIGADRRLTSLESDSSEKPIGEEESRMKTANIGGASRESRGATLHLYPESEHSELPNHPAKETASKVIDLRTVADRAAAAGVSIRTQKMADKVAKANPELVRQVAHGGITLPKALRQIEGKHDSQSRARGAETADAVVELQKSSSRAHTDKESSPDKPTPLEIAITERDEAYENAENLADELRIAKAELDAYRALETGGVEQALIEANKQVMQLEDTVRLLERRRNSLMQENAELKREIKSLRRKLGYSVHG